MSGMTYKQAGVDIDAGNSFSQTVKRAVGEQWPDVKIGGFAGRGAIPKGAKEYEASVDGVGTKVDLACLLGDLYPVGIDAVAMAAVDTYMAGARPSGLLDYILTDHIVPDLLMTLIKGIIAGCHMAGCKLLGGETAEHPGVRWPRGFVDVAAFCIGFPEEALRLCPQTRIKPGMKIYGWLSYGLGSNGYSLARKVFKLRHEDGPDRVRRAWLAGYYSQLGETLGQALLRPTAIYIKDIDLARQSGVKFVGHAHITGGGFIDNIPRILPEDCVAVINRSGWDRPPIFQLIEEIGEVSEQEMFRTFNQGIQVVSVVDAYCFSTQHFRLIGCIRERKGDEPQVSFRGKFKE